MTLLWLVILSGIPIICLGKIKPNIIIILADDLGWNDVSFHGSQQIPTPNIDGLAQHGIILNNYYVSPICTPSRSALMTGKYPIHTGLQHDVIYGDQPYGLSLKEKLLSNYLKELDYATHIVGKWHLGFFKTAYTPLYRGFDSHAGYYCGHEDYFDHTAQETSNAWGFDLRRNLSLWTEAFAQYSTDLYSSEAVDLINNHDTNRPLFLYLAHQAVHSANPYSPIQALPEDVALFAHITDPKRREFAGAVRALDRSVASVVKALHQKGILGNSIIVFSTDNGGPANGFNSNAASNWPLRGVKDTLWEGGVRGTGFIWSPLLNVPQRVSMQMMHVADWLPTLYSAAGGDVSTLRGIDGIDMWEALSFNRDSPRQEILHNIDDRYKIAALRVGQFKLVMGRTYNGIYDGWYPPWTSDSDQEKQKRNIFTFQNFLTTSDIEVILKKYRKPTASSRDVSPAVNCGPIPANASLSCQPHLHPCVFDVVDDPCEFHNLAHDLPDVLTRLLDRLAWYNSTAVPPRNKPNDPLGNPRLHGYNWEPWMDDDE